MNKREFLKTAAMSAATVGGVGAFERVSEARQEAADPYVRPPGAIPEEEFLNRCIRCFRCGEVCPKTAIKFASPDTADGSAAGDGPEGRDPSIVGDYREREEHPVESYDTPYLELWDTECILCMKCTEACPTGALQETDPDPESVQQTVDMGTARIDKRLCFSWNAWAEWTPEQDEFDRIEDYPGFGCGLCYDQCPYRGEAIEIDSMQRPSINEDACVGCGVCERTCPVGNGSSADPTSLLRTLFESDDRDLEPPAIKVEPAVEERPTYDVVSKAPTVDAADRDDESVSNDSESDESGWLSA